MLSSCVIGVAGTGSWEIGVRQLRGGMLCRLSFGGSDWVILGYGKGFFEDEYAGWMVS